MILLSQKAVILIKDDTVEQNNFSFVFPLLPAEVPRSFKGKNTIFLYIPVVNDNYNT